MTVTRIVATREAVRSEEHTSELQSRQYLVCRPPRPTLFPYNDALPIYGCGRHGRDFAPGIDAPPEPAQHEDESGSGSYGDQELPCSGDRIHVIGCDRGDDRDENCRYT